jgi:hypothetical protein
MKGNTTMITSVQSLTRIGETLPNGAVLIDRAWTASYEWSDGRVAHEGVVLALIPKGEYREYATWDLCLDPDRGEFTVSGRYTFDIVEAAQDFRDRVKVDPHFPPRILT